MSSIIGFLVRQFVTASLALAMTGLLAWSVIDSTTSAPSDQVAVRTAA